jgi:FixJ family two-component response regulator
MQGPVVAIIDDDSAFRNSLTRLIKTGGFETVAFPSAEDFLAAPAVGNVDCAVIDIKMQGLNGLELQEQMIRRIPGLSVVFLTGHARVSESVRAMKAGAVDFLQKPAGDDLLFAAIERGVQRSRTSRESLAELENLNYHYAQLTRRERAVFALVTAGLLNKQIGFHLGITERTIKVHRGKVMAKMKAKSFADLVRMADRLDIQRVNI